MESNKCSMTLTDRDFENIDYIQDLFNLKMGASAISRALEISRQLLELEHGKNQILVKNIEGKLLEVSFL